METANHSEVKTAFTHGLFISLGLFTQAATPLIDSFSVSALGYSAIATVGVGGAVTGALCALFSGLSMATQSAVGARIETQESTQIRSIVRKGLTFAISISLALALLIVPFSRSIFHLLLPHVEISSEALKYFQWRTFAILPFSLNCVLGGFFLAVGRINKWLNAVLLSFLSTLILELIFSGSIEIVGIAAFFSGLLALTIFLVPEFILGERNVELRADSPETRRFLTRALMASSHQFLFTIGVTLFFACVGKLGTTASTVTVILVDLFLFSLVPFMGIGTATVTFVSRYKRTKTQQELMGALRSILWISAGLAFLLGLPMVLFPRVILGFFIHEPAVIDIGIIPLKMLGVILPIDAMGVILMNVLYSVNEGHRAAGVSLGLQWFFCLPCAYFLAYSSQVGLLALWSTVLIWRLLQAFGLALIWKFRGSIAINSSKRGA